MFGKDEQYTTIMHQLLREIVNITLQMCAQLNGCNQLSEHSDVIEAFFMNVAQIYKKVPLLILTAGLDMSALFQCGKKLLYYMGDLSIVDLLLIFFNYILVLKLARSNSNKMQ